MKRVTLRLLVFGCCAAMVAASAQDRGTDADSSVAAYLWQPSMNVFRRFAAMPERMHEFYRDVLGLEQLPTLMQPSVVGGVARFRVGTQEIKLTARESDKAYVGGDVPDATGLRLITFLFPDESDLVERFEKYGFESPLFDALPGKTGAKRALVTDPDGQWVELIVMPDASPETYEGIEVGLAVADLERSREFYRNFVGLTELSPRHDASFADVVHRFRHGSTTVSLYPVDGDVPADTGSGGIQYVVSNLDRVAHIAGNHRVAIDVPMAGSTSALRTIWLLDPDGITNYFAETVASRSADVIARDEGSAR